jgi:DNA helicase II / ATP-dependent DNA helicase PcrA
MNRDITPYVLKRHPEESAPRKLSIDYAAALNPQQLAAVMAGDGPSLVIAGAGSGKTRTLVYRVAYLIDTGVDPSNILLLTFTRKSAHEMLHRAGELIGVRSERVCGGTFHSVANMLLRRYGRAIRLEPGFTILDRSDAEDLVALVRSQLGLNEKDKRFPRKGTIAEIFSKSENTLRGLDDIVIEECRRATGQRSVSGNSWTMTTSSSCFVSFSFKTYKRGTRSPGSTATSWSMNTRIPIGCRRM